MAQIQPVTTWFQGAEHDANVFNLYSNGDNLVDTATFQYQLIELTIIQQPPNSGIIITENSQTLVTGKLVINGQDYIDWDSSVSANEWIYNWAADKLGLTIVTI
jgi:hypothetical protein